MLQLFLNDRSFGEVECDKVSAIARLKQFVLALKTVASHHKNFVLNGPYPLSELHFAPNWPLTILRNDSECHTERVYLKTIAARAPFKKAVVELGGAPQEGIEYRLTNNAAVCAGETAVGLGLTHQFDGLALSVASHPYWDEPFITLRRLEMDEAADIRESAVEARNCTTVEVVAYHRNALADASAALIPTGKALWAQRTEIFPHLVFVPRTREQIELFEAGDEVFTSVVERLVGLNNAIAIWKETGSDHPAYPFEVRPESKTRKRKGLCDFNDANGTLRSFSDHLAFTPGAGRIHFILETEPVRHALIGHVGKKNGIG